MQHERGYLPAVGFLIAAVTKLLPQAAILITAGSSSNPLLELPWVDKRQRVLGESLAGLRQRSNGV